VGQDCKELHFKYISLDSIVKMPCIQHLSSFVFDGIDTLNCIISNGDAVSTTGHISCL
jgi:hypothetical protein